MPIQNRLTQVALAKQVALGTVAPSGTAGLQIGVKAGVVASVDISQDDIGMTWGSRLSEGEDRGAMTPGAAFDVVAMPASLGHLLNAALGAPSTSGGGPTYSHEFTPQSSLPYYTVHARKGSEYFRVGDSILSELELTWEGTKALVAKATWIGCDYGFLSGAYTAATDERPKDGSLRGAGGTFQVLGADAIVKSGSIKIANGAEAVHGSAQSYPETIALKMVQITGTLTIVVEDLAMFRSVVTGSSSGQTPSAVEFTGDVDLSWIDGTNTLTVDINDASLMTEFPDTAAEGGPVELQVAFKVQAGNAVPCKLTLVNGKSSY